MMYLLTKLSQSREKKVIRSSSRFIIGSHNPNSIRWHSIDNICRKKTTLTPTEGVESEKTKYQMQKHNIWVLAVQQQITNLGYQNHTSKTI